MMLLRGTSPRGTTRSHGGRGLRSLGEYKREFSRQDYEKLQELSIARESSLANGFFFELLLEPHQSTSRKPVEGRRGLRGTSPRGTTRSHGGRGLRSLGEYKREFSTAGTTPVNVSKTG
jgi:hypothetical protein